MLHRLRTRKSGFYLAIGTLIASASVISTPALASGTCQDQAVQRCELNWYDGRFPQYRTIEECYEGEMKNCNPYACNPGCYTDTAMFLRAPDAMTNAPSGRRAALLPI